MTFARSQKGMSLFSWMVVLVLVAFFASISFKLIPHYMNNKALEKVVALVEDDPTLEIRTVADFYRHLNKGMNVNSINLKAEDAFEIKIVNNSFIVKMAYEQREPVIRNIDMVVRFEKEYRVRMP